VYLIEAEVVDAVFCDGRAAVFQTIIAQIAQALLDESNAARAVGPGLLQSRRTENLLAHHARTYYTAETFKQAAFDAAEPLEQALPALDAGIAEAFFERVAEARFFPAVAAPSNGSAGIAAALQPRLFSVVHLPEAAAGGLPGQNGADEARNAHPPRKGVLDVFHFPHVVALLRVEGLADVLPALVLLDAERCLLRCRRRESSGREGDL
jgi:hypothetical protein